ncbi:hypothetical protein HDU67_004959 [Dinochytrium kinnereticum]|nr:hypothetical protein HDU67_004959 [Dinochytrium kinnereticum]
MTAWSLVQVGRSPSGSQCKRISSSTAATNLESVIKHHESHTNDPPTFVDLPSELFICIARMNLTPHDLSNLSRTSKKVRHVLMEYRSSLFEHLIASFDQDMVAAYRSISPSFISLDRTRCANTSVWGPSVMAACHLRKPISAESPKRDDAKGKDRSSMGSTKNLMALSQRDAYYDLRRIQSWLDTSKPLVERTVRNLSRYAKRRMEWMSWESGSIVLSSSWVAAATVLEFRKKRLVALEEAVRAVGGGVSLDGEMLVTQKRKMADASRRLRIHAVRMVILFFAITIGVKREAKSCSGNTNSSPTIASRSASPLASPTETAQIVGFSMSLTSPPSQGLPPLQDQPPQPPEPLALIPMSMIPIISMQSVAQWRLLRDLDSDSLTGLAVVLQSAHELLSDRFVGAGLEPQQASLHAFHAVSLGPKAVGAILSAASDAIVADLVAANPSLRPGAGPFMFNAVLGVLNERGVGF